MTMCSQPCCVVLGWLLRAQNQTTTDHTWLKHENTVGSSTISHRPRFVRGQDEANRLSKESWEHLQDSTGMSCVVSLLFRSLLLAYFSSLVFLVGYSLDFFGVREVCDSFPKEGPSTIDLPLTINLGQYKRLDQDFLGLLQFFG